MKNRAIPILLGCLSFSFTVPTAPHSSHGNITATNGSRSSDAGAAITLYHSLQLKEAGLSQEAFQHAWKGYRYLLQHNKLARTRYLTICDFSQSSKKQRLYIIDIENQQLVKQTYVAHGRNSGGVMATRFSNKLSSLQSSLGFYVTTQTYTGKHGLSLRIQGMEPGINDKAMQRTVVIHGAHYVDPSRASSTMGMGRSFGCPAVPKKEATTIIETIKNGTCLFIYHPQKNYLDRSTILND